MLPPSQRTDRCLWKYYLPAKISAGGKISPLFQDNPGCGDCTCDHAPGANTNQSCCTCIQDCHCTCSYAGLSHCCPCSCPCYLATVQSTWVQVCSPCGCECGVCEDGVGGLKCCSNCPSCSSCFPTTARVTLESGISVAMSELQIGDRVQTGKDILLICIDILYIGGKFIK